ncbi:MAG: M23 family metallopeptidase, partial [Anaerolineae bacterium]|nr:M23 family metallopeptidase [Anaerolineae bacterium]
IATALLAVVVLSNCATPQDDLFTLMNVPSSTPTSFSLETTAMPTLVTPEPTAASGATREPPMRFDLPTPGPEPISLWRPPLNEVPWALGPNDHFYFARPIAADEVNWPLANYRYGGIFFGWDIIHTGVDIPAPVGTPVLAAASGKVIWAGYGLLRGDNDINDPYGLAVVVRHDFGWQGRRLNTVYAHMDRIDVKLGQLVDTGTQLGIIGTTGATTGPHLHFEVRVQTNTFFSTRNPELWLVPPQGWGVLAGRVLNTSGSLIIRKDVQVRSLETGRRWVVITYGGAPANGDDYYRENVALSDLPEGWYEIVIVYDDDRYVKEIFVPSGGIAYFSFQGKKGFGNDTLPTPEPESILKPWLE